MADPAGRFSIGFDNNALDWTVDWTHLDQEHPNLVTRYTIDRGRQFELDRTDGGRATVEIIDPDGILDPGNPAGPYYGQLEPTLPARIGRQNPVTGEWFTRFRGFIDEFRYEIDPSQRLGRLTVTLVDIFEALQAIEMQLAPTETTKPAFGDRPPPGFEDNLFFQGQPNGNMSPKQRIEELLLEAKVPAEFAVVFTMNVWLWATVYSPGESVMTVIQEAADADFPGVANVYVDRHGRLCVHGREAKFDPEGVESGTTPDVWDFREFTAGDGAAVAGAPATTAQIRRFAYDRGLSKIINHASAWPFRPPGEPQLKAATLAGQVVQDDTSIGRYGYRSWTAQNLLTYSHQTAGGNDLTETKRFAQYYAENYAYPRNRVNEIAFRSINLAHPAATPTWNLISRVDISDSVSVTVTGPSGALFDETEFFVEGVHEQVEPLTPDMDDVTLSLDLSPRAYYPPDNPWS